MCAPEETLDAEQLAARYVLAREDGEDVDLEELASRLPDTDARQEFRQLIADAGALQGLLPVQVRPGVVLGGRYKVLREVGSGGMGKVFEAEDSELQRRVAVKVLAVFGNAAFDSAKQFRREAQLLAALQHPNIVAIHEVGHDGDVTYMVMDLVQGQSLHLVIEWVSEKLQGQKPRDAALLEQAVPMSLPEGAEPVPRERHWFRAVARLGLGIARTIESAHAHGLVHRDIKPQNILLRADGTPVLLDFGLAGIAESEGGDVTRGLFGSAAYLAPEQAVTGQVGSDPRTDVYQLGTVLYELLTLQRAYPGTGITDLLRRISMGDFVAPRKLDKRVPFELEAICLRAMETHPNDRYQSAADFAEDLACFLDGSALPVAARSGRLGSLLRRARYAVKRQATLAAVTVTVLGALAVFFALGLFGESWPSDTPRFFRWTPGDVAGDAEAKIAAGGGSLVFRSESDRAGPGDMLGLELEAAEPTYVFALSAFGSEVAPQWFVPMQISELASRSPAAASWATTDVGEPSGRWGLKVPTGDVRLVCTELGPRAADVAHEGLWVFTSAEPQPRLDAWLTRMDRQHGGGRVSYAEALAAFDAAGKPELTRGRSVELTDQQRQALFVDFTVADMREEDGWPVEDPQLHAVSFAVHEP